MSDEEKKDISSIEEFDKKVLSKIKADINPLITRSHDEGLSVLEEMNKISLVTPDDVAKLSAAKQFVFESHSEVPSHRTLIQKQAGVLTNGRFNTPDAKFWQCKKEAEVQFRELLRAHNKYRRACVDIKEILYKIEKLKTQLEENDPNVDNILLEFDLERLLLRLEEYNMNLKILEKDIKYRIKEISDWHILSEGYKENLKHDEHNHAAHEIESFTSILVSEMHKAKKDGNESAVKMFTDQIDTLKSILSSAAKEALKEKKED